MTEKSNKMEMSKEEFKKKVLELTGPEHCILLALFDFGEKAWSEGIELDELMSSPYRFNDPPDLSGKLEMAGLIKTYPSNDEYNMRYKLLVPSEFECMYYKLFSERVGTGACRIF